MIVGLQRMSMGDLDPDQILSPSRDQLGAETDQLLARMQQLGEDFFTSDSNILSPAQLARWDAFVDEVKNWDAGPRIFTHLFGTTWRDELIAYQKKFNDFATEFRAAGVGVVAPPFTFTPPPSTIDKVLDKAGNAAAAAAKPVVDLANTLKWVAIGGGVLGAAFIFYLTYETGKTARAIGPRVLR